MSGKETCKRNYCKRNQINNCGWKKDNCFNGEGYGWKGDGFYDYGYDGNYGWKGDFCGEHNCYDDCYRNNHAAKRNCFDNAERKECDNAFEEKKCVNEHFKHDVDKHKCDKEFEDKHRRRNHQACGECGNVCCRDHSRKNKKYLVDKLYIYEHHRVIDLDCCENDRNRQEAHKDFRDLETAIEDFKEADYSTCDFSDENRKDLEAYENARRKTRNLQAEKKNCNAAYVWSD